MINFSVDYHNIDLNVIKKKLNDNKKISINIINTLENLESLTILNQTNDLYELQKISEQLLINKKTIFIFGIGGSCLGAKSLINILYGKEKINIIFVDNIDPIQFKNLIVNINLDETGFIFISKSGSTPEILSHFASLFEIFENQNLLINFFKNIIIITENNNNPLKKIALKFDLKTLDHNKNIGGRFSVFSNVGLFPALLAGLNIFKIREGANELILHLHKNSFNDAFIGAMISNNLKSSKSINLNILMTYSESLYFFGKWYLQLWAESIGKQKKGTTPIHAVGATDQHSQLQLYLDGPKDKYYSIITTDHAGKGLKMNKKILEEVKVDYIAGKYMGDLMQSEQKATLDTLINSGSPVRQILCNKIDEKTIGQLMAYFMIETIAACYFIGVNPFDQPSVEQGKILTKKYLSN